MSKVGIEIGVTKNTGNFENFRLNVHVEDEQKPGETTNQLFERVYEYAERKLVEKTFKAMRELGVSE